MFGAPVDAKMIAAEKGDHLIGDYYVAFDKHYRAEVAELKAKYVAEGMDKIPDGCALIGVSEVENDHVLRDLVGQPALAARNFKFCHIEGPDRRGVDCALLYNPKYFKVNDVRLVPYVPDLPKDSTFKTRGFLTVSGELAGEPVTVVVCHWPSRFNGSFYRETAGREVRAVKVSLLRADPGRKVFVMGDMNDDPTNNSMYEKLGCGLGGYRRGEG